MGEKYFFQPLTREDKISVIMYRAGIVFSTLILLVIAAALNAQRFGLETDLFSALITPWGMSVLLLILYFSVGLSVYFIHLYIGRLHRMLKQMYGISVLCLIGLFVLGKGIPATPVFLRPPYPALLLLPVSLCLGFVTAKEAFCFKLFEGYMLAVIMPAYMLFFALGLMTQRGSLNGAAIVAILLLFFTLRKTFMPIHYDIGDKSAYQP